MLLSQWIKNLTDPKKKLLFYNIQSWKTCYITGLFLHHNKRCTGEASFANFAAWSRYLDFVKVQGLFPVAVTLHTQPSDSLHTVSYPSFFTGDTTPPYLHTSLLTYFGSPITPISLLSDAIHHRSSFSPRPPHPTYLGTYVLLLCRHSSNPLPIMSVPPSFAFFRRNHIFFYPHTNV